MFVPKTVASKVILGVHSYSHPGVDKTLELLQRRYRLNGFTPQRYGSLQRTSSSAVIHVRPVSCDVVGIPKCATTIPCPNTNLTQ